MQEALPGITDLLLLPIYLTYIYFIAWWYQRKKRRTNPEYKWFLPALTIKIIGGMAFALVYLYYYGFGDTFQYFKAAKRLVDIGVNDFSEYLKLMTYSNREIMNYYGFEWNNLHEHIESGNDQWFLIRLLSIINFISFNSFITSTLIFSVFSFIGGWFMFKGLYLFDKSNHRASLISVFFIPSVIFWGGGIMKDTLALVGLGFTLNGLVKLYMKQFKIGLFIFIIGFYVTFKSKSYVALPMIPAIGMAIYYRIQKSNQDKVVKYLLSPAFLIIIISTISFLFISLSKQSEKYALNSIKGKIKGFHSWHTFTGGSSYNLNITNYNPGSLLLKAPEAINVALFRPYVWEVRNPIIFLQAIEGIIFLILFYFSIKSFKKYNWTQNFWLIGILTYGLIMAYSTGLTSYNFGALARYKMPATITIGYILLVGYSNFKESRKAIL